MRPWRTPLFWTYSLLTFLQPILLVLVGAIDHVPTRGITFMLVLLLGLGYGSRIVWGLLVVLNAVPLLAIGGLTFGSGGHPLWINVVVMVLTGAALEIVLLSRPMRRHLGNPPGPPRRLAPPPTA